MCKQDIKGEEKYNLEVEKDGKSRLCYGPFLELLKFKTIKDAQRYVLYNEIAIETMWQEGEKTMYARKTADVWILEGNYGCGWEYILEESTSAYCEAKRPDLRSKTVAFRF